MTLTHSKLNCAELSEHYQLTGEQLSNTSQNGLHRTGLPSETFTKIEGKKGTSHRSSKERATTLPCANACGTNRWQFTFIEARSLQLFKDIATK